MSAGSRIIPTMRYRDARAALRWLVEVLGCEERLVVPSEDGTGVAHAQLTLGGGMIMLGSVRKDEFGALLKQPEEIGGAETQMAYVVVEDVDAVHAKALARGGRELSPPMAPEHGGRFSSFADPEGHVWAIGSYDPWA